MHWDHAILAPAELEAQDTDDFDTAVDGHQRP